MGYISKDIAVISEPKKLTLSGLPNFVSFASKPSEKNIIAFSIKALFDPTTPDLENASLLAIEFYIGGSWVSTEFFGTIDPLKVGGNVFFVNYDPTVTAENLRLALLSNQRLAANFEISSPITWSLDVPQNGETIYVRAKGAGNDFNISGPGENLMYEVVYSQKEPFLGDTISGEANTAQISLDVYINPTIFYGQNDAPTTSAKIGTFLATLDKTYVAGRPLWFDINALISQYPPHKLPFGDDWTDPGTLTRLRFFARVKNGVNNISFYQSDTLFILSGYGKASDNLDLQRYVYRASLVGTMEILTNRPKTPYVRGGKEYINFLFEDEERESNEPSEYDITAVYHALTTAGDFLGIINGVPRSRAALRMLNSCRLNLDGVLDAYPNTGIIRVALARDGVIISNSIEFMIRPECLHVLNNFTFISRLGGWEGVNFDADEIDEVKPERLTYSKTLAPDFKRGDSIETVYDVTLDNTYSVEGAPVSNAVALWLKEFAASRVILNKDGYYVILEDFTLRASPENSNRQIPSFKYKLSENYTNG